MANKNFKARIGIEAPLIAADDGTTAITLSNNDVTVVGDLTVTSNVIKSSSATALTLSGANVEVAGDLTVNDAVIFDGSTSGTVTIAAPAVAGTQAYTLPTALPAVTGYVLSGTTGGALSWVADADTNTTYDFNATSSTGGANLNLVGSDATTDTVKLTDGGHITATYTSGTAITLGSDATNVNTAGTIVARNGSGDFSAGTITANLANNSYVLGALEATTNTAFTFPIPALNTTTNNNGLDVASSMPASTDGNGAQQQIIHYYGDTRAGINTTSALNMKAATGNSVTGGTVPFTGVAQVAAGAVAVNNVMGVVNFNGYATTGWSELIASQNQGGGLNTNHALQVQGIAAEAFADGTLTITPTAVTRSAPANLANVQVSGTKGQITFTSQATPLIGQAMLVTGVNTGTSTGIVAGTYYLISATGTTGCTLSATPGGVPITTTAGTTTGLTFARRFITVTYATQTYIPFGLNAKITISDITGATNGTYMASGTSTTTSVNIGVVTDSVALGASPALTCPTVTAMGAGLRVRAMPLGKPGNSGNRVELVNHNATTAKYRSDSFTIASAAYGTTGTDIATFTTANTTVKSDAVTLQTSAGVALVGSAVSYNRVYGQFQYDTTVTPVAADTAYVFPLGTADINNIATVGSTSRLIPGAAGVYNLQFSIQVDNADNSNDHDAYVWLRKNGADVTGSMGRTTVTKNNAGSLKIIAWNYIVSSANTTDYWEIAYAVSDTDVTFPAFGTTAFGPSTACIITSLTPVGV